MSIVRVHKKDKYSVIANEPINDQGLSWGARGMLAYLLSKPNDWQVRMADLEAQSPAGAYATKTLVHELEKAGYMRRKRVKDKEGKFIWITTVYETKINTIPQLSTDGLSTDGKPHDIVSTDLLSTESLTPDGEKRPPPRKKGDFLDAMIAAEGKRNGRADLGFLYEHLRPLGQAFIDAAGTAHTPAKHEKSKWCKILGEWYELGFIPGQITKAVEKMRNEGLTIGGPESVTKTARDVYAAPDERVYLEPAYE